jgi:outer membrane lipoprotein-sorting protein
MGDRVGQVLLEITPESRIDRIVIEGADDSTTEYRITNQKEDVSVAEQRFKFHVPNGVEVISGDLSQ